MGVASGWQDRQGKRRYRVCLGLAGRGRRDGCERETNLRGEDVPGDGGCVETGEIALSEPETERYGGKCGHGAEEALEDVQILIRRIKENDQEVSRQEGEFQLARRG